EFEEVSQRYEYLTSQRDDLESAIGTLQEAIDRIDETTKVRFEETFHAVNDMFQKLFPRLFNGGRAELVMTEPNDLLNTGVEIMAQPPGKKIQSLELLSGGEKALTAVSLIFGIFLIKSSPFCLLDEVDAPLDEANVGRFCDLVAELAQRTQFIIITHNKRTMEIADRLYGVTMQQPGASKLVSVSVRRPVEGAQIGAWRAPGLQACEACLGERGAPGESQGGRPGASPAVLCDHGACVASPSSEQGSPVSSPPTACAEPATRSRCSPIERPSSGSPGDRPAPRPGSRPRSPTSASSSSITGTPRHPSSSAPCWSTVRGPATSWRPRSVASRRPARRSTCACRVTAGCTISRLAAAGSSSSRSPSSGSTRSRPSTI